MDFSSFPQPPVGMEMNTTWQAVFTVGQAIPATIMIIIAVVMLRRYGTPIPLLCLVGGAVAILIEPVVDVLGLVWFPREGQWVLFEAFGRQLPVFLIVYIWFVGGQTFLVWHRMERGVTTREIWLMYLAFTIINIPTETPGLYMDLYAYYGAQPFTPFRLPLMWPIVNALMPLAAATAIYRLRPYLHGWRVVGVVALVPMADGTVNLATAFPLYITLNTDLGFKATYPAFFVMLALALLVVKIITIAVATDAEQPERSVVTHDRQAAAAAG